MKKSTLLPIILLIMFFSCKKDYHDQILDNRTISKLKTSSSNISSTAYPTASDDNDSIETPTVIDYQLPNPYLIPNMQQAYYNVTGQNTTPAVTNLYVRFKPSDIDELKSLTSLTESLGLDLFDEPLDYHIVQEGDYYQDPSIPMEEITWQYSVVPPDFQPPSGMQYEVLASIHIPENMLVEAEGERLVGLNADGDDYNDGGSFAAENNIKGKISPKVPQCLPGYHWDFNLRQCVPDNCPDGYHWDGTRCQPDAPPPPPPNFIPGGRLQVFDTRLDNTPPISSFDPTFVAQPLRTVHVIARRWFKIDRTYSNTNGNFQVTKHYRNKVKLFVEFKNQFSTIRAMRGIRVWQLLFPLKRKIGTFTNSTINTVRYTFLQTPNISSLGNKFWTGATTFNAVQEHKDYAVQFSFAAAPVNLNIYITSWAHLNGLASTPLFHERNYPSTPVAFVRTFLVNTTIRPIAVTEQVVVALLHLENVDMALDYHRDNLAELTSDGLKETIYHESSHASQYLNIGLNAYADFVDAELRQIIAHSDPNDPLNPYGPGNSADAPFIAVGESWGYHMGHFLADQRYGIRASCTSEQIDANGFGIFICPNGTNHPHIDVLERFDPNLPTDPFNWIPKGLLEDMMDNTNEFNPVIDRVSGFTIQQLFDALQSDITSPQQYRDRLLQQNGNNQAIEVINLFSQYNYN